MEHSMAEEWERNAVKQEITELITDGAFAGDYRALKQAIDSSKLLDERDEQQLLQYWMAKEREASRPPSED